MKNKFDEKNSRKPSQCAVSKKCGGCQYIDMPYKEQLARKQRQVEMLLKGFGRVKPILGMERPAHYRNKVHAVFDFQKGKGIVSGIYQERSHHVVPVESCLLEDEKADQIIASVRKLAGAFKIKTYNEDTGFGLLRHVLVRTAHATGQIMVVLVLSSPILPSKKNFISELCKLHKEITTVIINVNNRHTSMVLGDKEQVIYGKGYIEDVLCGRTFKISSKSFYQVNSVQTQALYEKAIEYAALTGKETVVDAYCGIGTIALTAAELAGKVIAVELNQDAVRDAIANVKINQIRNVDVYQNDAGRFMTQLAEAGERVDVVFMDPPRNGSTEEFLEAVLRLNPDRVVYISCNPETLERDLRYLTGRADGNAGRPDRGGKEKRGRRGRYRMVEATPVDMFPFTANIETVCLLSSRKPDTKVRLDVDLEDYYRIKDVRKNR